MPAVNQETNLTIQSIKTEIRSRFLMNAAVIFSIICCGVILILLLCENKLSNTDAALIVFFASILLMVTNSIAFRKTEAAFRRDIRDMAELMPDYGGEFSTDDILSADAEYAKERDDMKRERNLIIILSTLLSIVFPLALLLGIIIAAVRWKKRFKQLEMRQLSPYLQLDIYAGKWHSGLQTGAFAVLFAAFIFALIAASLQFIAGNIVSAANYDAKAVYRAAVTYQIELEEQNLSPHFETMIVPCGEVGAEGTLSYGICRYYSDSTKFWYAVVCDDNGNITETYCSREPLTQQDLTPKTVEEQRKIAENIFSRNDLIGYYTPTEGETNGTAKTLWE